MLTIEPGCWNEDRSPAASEIRAAVVEPYLKF
jgi:hypothetical protein